MNGGPKPEQANLWAKRGVLFVICVLLATVGLLWITIFASGQDSIEGITKSFFLPVVFQPESLAMPSSRGFPIHWNESTIPFENAAGQAVVIDKGDREFLYVLGGGESFEQLVPGKYQIRQTDHAKYSEIYEDGSLGAWSGTSGSNLPILPLLPYRLYGFSATAVNGNLYLLGGYTYPATGPQYPNFNPYTYCGKVENNGGFQDWVRLENSWQSPQDPHYDDGVAFHATAVVGNRIYLIGGMRRSKYFNKPWEPTTYVYSAEVGNSCENLQWELEAELPTPVMSHTAVAAENGSIYIFGGRTYLQQPSPCAAAPGKSDPIQFRAQMNNHTITQWITQTNVPSEFTGIQFSTAVNSGDYIYLIGGTKACRAYDGEAQNTIYRLKIGEDKNIQNQEIVPQNLLTPVYAHAAVTSKIGRIYLIGGVNTPTNPGGSPIIQNTIYWTPLSFFDKESLSSNIVVPGEQIVYKLTATSNNIRDLVNPTVEDILPNNVELLSAPGFNRDGQKLTRTLSILPVGHKAIVYIAVIVRSATTIAKPETSEIEPSQVGSIPGLVSANATPASLLAFEEPLMMALPGSNGQFPQSPDCLTGGGRCGPTPTPKPDPECFPTPTVTITATPTVTVTITPTFTPTVTPTITITPTVTETPVTPTPTSVPIMVLNQAKFCYRGWCLQSNYAISAPYQTYLPFVNN
ncbi:MAG: hypothetical protein KC445_10650 [Anaerolineales bacterium]|nr:hypothetical protein [Anaerolineales bacterium]